MEIKEFLEETDKIERYYSKELDKFQREIWFSEFKNLNIQRYRQIVREVFRSCKFMPKLADLIEINNTLAYAKKESIQETCECKRCEGKGFILYTKIVKNGNRDLQYQMFARCDCKNGEKYCYDGTKINDVENRSKFYVSTIAQVGV